MAVNPSFIVSKKSSQPNLTQTHIYKVATIAREKLGHAADEADHNLRFIVGHANLLDGTSIFHKSSWPD